MLLGVQPDILQLQQDGPVTDATTIGNSFSVHIDLTHYPGTDTRIFPFYFNPSIIPSSSINSAWTISGWFTFIKDSTGVQTLDTAGSGASQNYLLYFGETSSAGDSHPNSMSIVLNDRNYYYDPGNALSHNNVVPELQLLFGDSNAPVRRHKRTTPFQTNTWYYYAATFDGSPTPTVDSFRLYTVRCDEHWDSNLENTEGGRAGNSDPSSKTITYSGPGYNTFGPSTFRFFYGSPSSGSGGQNILNGYRSDLAIWNSKLTVEQLKTLSYRPTNLFELTDIPRPTDWWNWQRTLSNNISNRPDFGFTTTDIEGYKYDFFIDWKDAHSGHPCGGDPNPPPPLPPGTDIGPIEWTNIPGLDSDPRQSVNTTNTASNIYYNTTVPQAMELTEVHFEIASGSSD